MDREKVIVKTSIVGILVNIALVIFKMIVGIIANSIAIIIDAVNNLSDVLSSVITIIGTKLANKKPDKKHPYGHGRIEYFSSVIIALLIFTAGLAALRESALKIINPTKATYAVSTIIVIISAIFTKLFLSRYVIKKGKDVNSQSLVASGKDAFFDSIISTSTLAAALVSMFLGLSLEGYLGVIIAAIIIKASIEIFKETIDEMIGTRIDSDYAKRIKDKINSFKEVEGTYDLMLHSYGPSKMMGSAHIQISDDLTTRDIHLLTRKIEYAVYKEFGIALTLGVYASNTSNEKAQVIREALDKIIEKYPTVLQIHGFYIDEEIKTVSFDIIIDFEDQKPKEIRDKIIAELQDKYPEYNYIGIIDTDISD